MKAVTRGDAPPRVAVHTDGTVSCGTVLWRVLGGLQLTVVVKAQFAIVHEGVATSLGPAEIVAVDRTRGAMPESSVEAASDLAPFLLHCDVLFTGHAHAIGGAVPASAVRLRMSRYGRWVLDKTIHVYGDRAPGGAPAPFSRMPIVYERSFGGPGSANPVGNRTPNLADPVDARRPAGFGPISRRWPSRRALLGSIDARTIEGPVPEIPEAIPVEYYQAAPRDQQVELLRGGEWLVLDGLDAERRRTETWLPSARGAARILVCRPGAPDAEIPVELGCDTLAIDGDRQTLSLTWRGRCALPEGEAMLPSLMVLAALERSEGSIDWGEIRPTVVAEAPPREPVRPRQSTVVMSPSSGAARPPKAALPFGQQTPGPAGLDEEQTSPALQIPQRPPSMPRQSTVTLPPAELAALRSYAALPFAPSGAPANPPSTDATPWTTRPTPPSQPAVAPPGEASAPATSFGLGMRLSSAPLSMPPRPPDDPPWPAHALDQAEDDDEIDTVQEREPTTPGDVPRAPGRVVVPPPRTMVPAPLSAQPLPPAMIAGRPSEPPLPPAMIVAPSSERPPPLWAAPPAEQPPPLPAPPPVDEPPPAVRAPAPERTVRHRSYPAPPDPWAEPFVPSAKPAPPPPQPTTFERPAAAAVKGSFYSKFVRK